MNDHPDIQHLDPSDPYARAEQTFPSLSEEMATRIAAYGKEDRLTKGQVVFQRGERGVDSPANSTCSTTGRRLCRRALA